MDAMVADEDDLDDGQYNDGIKKNKKKYDRKKKPK